MLFSRTRSCSFLLSASTARKVRSALSDIEGQVGIHTPDVGLAGENLLNHVAHPCTGEDHLPQLNGFTAVFPTGTSRQLKPRLKVA